MPQAADQGFPIAGDDTVQDVETGHLFQPHPEINAALDRQPLQSHRKDQDQNDA